VYKNLLEDTYFFQNAIKFFAVSQLIRAEYMSFHFKQRTIELPFEKLKSFLSTFVAKGSEITTSIQTCALRVNIDQPSGHHNPIVDLKDLVSALSDRPGVQLEFCGGGSFNWEARNIKDFVQRARQNPQAWSLRAQDFESIEVRTRTDWYAGKCDSMSGNYLRRPKWTIRMVVSPAASEAWWNDKQELERQTVAVLVELGMRKMIGNGPFHSSVLPNIDIRLERDQ
jgi:hypothetical protein